VAASRVTRVEQALAPTIPKHTDARIVAQASGLGVLVAALGLAVVPTSALAQLIPSIAGLVLPLLAIAAGVSGRSRAMALAGASMVVLVVIGRALDAPGVATQLIIVAAIGSGALILATSETTRKRIEALIAIVHQLRSRDARRSKQFAAIDRVGRLVAEDGASSERLNLVVDLLVGEFDYSSAAVFLADGPILRATAWSGFTAPVMAMSKEMGIMGRVILTGEPVLVPDVHLDPDYLNANDDTRSELVVPLKVDGELLGLLNIESSRATSLDNSDLELATLVAERISTALILGREKTLLAERGAVLESLVEFGAAISGTDRPENLERRLIAAIRDLLPADKVIVLLSRSKVDSWLAEAVEAEDDVLARSACQEAIITGRVAIRELVEDSQIVSGRSVRETPYTAAALPLIRDREISGAVILTRLDRSKPFSSLEADAMSVASTHAASAAIAAQLLGEAEEAAVRDPLTGLHNRRYFQEAGPRAIAAWRRSRSKTNPLSAILFDLDHFGAVNNEHGHQTGDDVLRAFGSVLAGRLRAADIAARYGGEEFVALLEDASHESAVRIADDIRVAFGHTNVACADGCQVAVTVSAGVAAVEDGESLESLVRRADSALYEAKAQGRDRVSVFQHGGLWVSPVIRA